MKISDFVKLIRAIRRIRQVISIFAKHGFYQIITNIGLSKFFIFKKYLKAAYPVDDYLNVPPEIRLRYAMEELGPTFIKLGQVFSQEIRTLPLKYIEELRKLQDATRADFNNIKEIDEIFKNETGKNIEDVFESFDEIPVASASIAQVHKAVLKDGTKVAVKIKKRNVDKSIKNDIDVLYFIVGIIKEAVKELLYIDNVEDLFKEFSKSIMSELDFMAEAGYTEKIRKSNLDKDTVEIPKIYWQYSAKSILVEDFIDGVKVSDIDELSKKGYDNKVILKIFLNHFFKQIFIIGYFNADPHPGNVFVIDREKIGIIDFGSVGILTKDLRKKILKYFIEFFNAHYEEAASLFIEICMGDLTDKEEQIFKFELMEFIESFYNKPFKDIYSSEILLETLRIGQKNKLTIPSELSLLFKALLPIESIAKTLDPDFSFVDSGLKFFDFDVLIDKKEKVKDIKESFVDKFKNYKDLFSGFPKRADKILKKMSEDNFSIDFIHKGLDGLIGEMEKSSKRMTNGLLIASLIISSGILVFIGSVYLHFYILIMGIAGWVMGLMYILILLLK
ncbi:MAG: AarF/UbiB family protein [Deltaproteobacteria bacterium]|jgi:ubiquinone biosynthesis protein|uniref:AarF/ABC1/UbiB kinase family protein n=1 Tax=Candidatus Acidulodesulfobacterium acidiphilum TaxID=2597224 RepID=A0A520XFY7_9DELT|nr:AarF/UbiB family protein [Deltaproteobacteria bacterium]MDA8298396.1 AarF/UbiB family protein [Deltaproteobacteria bacterium]RZV39995.1 MAG: AarF/ABC1/UbiB kinase family protein [Candidatus Acidulodesulfobacterium acidiphilum]